MAADLHGLAENVARRFDLDEQELAGEVPDLMHTLRVSQVQARERYLAELAAELERVLQRWLTSLDLDAEDENECLKDLDEASNSEHASAAIARVIVEWNATAQALADPDRREILTGSFAPEDMLPLDRPA